jgi:hypothetical protein
VIRPMTPIAVVMTATATASNTDDNAWWLYASEVLDHLCLEYQVLTPGDISATTPRPSVVLVPSIDIAGAAEDQILTWVEQGSAAVMFGVGPATARATGITVNGDSVTALPHTVRFVGSARELSAFGGECLDAPLSNAEAIARYEDGRPAAISVGLGEGRLEIWGADPWHSIVRIQQGWSISEPAAPAPDGSVPKRDMVLRADDSLSLAYSRRRLPDGSEPVGRYEHCNPPPGPSPMFVEPEADYWRAEVLAALIRAYDASRTQLAWLDYWPSGTPAIAHMSHDSDRNIDSQADLALAAFSDAGVRVTWCHCHPGGYTARAVAAIAAAGHEQALHYNAMEDTPHDRWGLEHLAYQLSWARDITGEPVVSNKNHYTRWEGWAEFYEWCDELGIELDQSRGPSKQGTVGFPFGSAHPSRPMLGTNRGNALAKVLELPFHTQDLGYFADESVREPILRSVAGVHGVAHFLYHGANMEHHPDVTATVARTAEAARQHGMEWWTAGQISSWERTRRQVTTRWRPDTVDASIVTITSDIEVPGLGLLTHTGDCEVMPVAIDTRSGRRLPVSKVFRHGFSHWLTLCDVPAGGMAVRFEKDRVE